MRKLLWILVALIGAFAVGGIALHRGETINAMWIVVAAVCVYAIGYRFYSAWVAARVLSVDATRATPALRLNNGRDFMPTHRWIVFGHHFAAIAGPGPLIGPTLAAQFGYLPGTLWILVGAVLGGCVQDMTILFLSTRRNGRSLGQMARDELGPVGGFAAIIGTLTIMIILIAVLGLVVVNAMKHSPWATVDGVRDDSDRGAGRAVPAQHPAGPRARRHRSSASRCCCSRSSAAAGSITTRRCARCSTSTASRSRGS